jgi:hypothetical protein
MHRLRVGAVAGLLCAAALCAVPARAAASPGVIVLTGQGSGYTDITLAHQTRILPMHLAIHRDPDGHATHTDGWSWRGCGRLRGFYLRPFKKDPLAGAGAIEFADLRFGQATDLPLPGGDIARMPVPLAARYLDPPGGQTPNNETPVVLSAGRYRAFLFGQGSCEIRVPAPGVSGTLRVRTMHPSTVQAHVSTGRPGGSDTPAVPAVQAVLAHDQITVRPNTFVLVMLHRVGYTLAHADIVASMCVELDPSPTCSETPLNRSTTRSGSYVHGAGAHPPPPVPVVSADVTDFATWYAPAWLRSGNLTAKVYGATTQTAQLQALTLAIDL